MRSVGGRYTDVVQSHGELRLHADLGNARGREAPLQQPEVLLSQRLVEHPSASDGKLGVGRRLDRFRRLSAAAKAQKQGGDAHSGRAAPSSVRAGPNHVRPIAP